MVFVKVCSTDADCDIVPTYGCCGPGTIVGLAKATPQYRACFQTREPQGCGNVGCFSQARTEDQMSAPLAPLNLAGVTVHCESADGGPRLCMTHYEPDGGTL